MRKSDDLYDLSPEQLEIFSDGKYLPGNYKREADAFLKTCIGARKVSSG